MSGNLFNWSRKREPPPAIQFGRYTDNNKSAEKIKAWTESDRQFRDKDFTRSRDAFFEYLRDDVLQNVVTGPRGPDLDFTIFQGSAEIRGSFKNDKVRAEVNIAKMSVASVPVMRKLLEQNFNLFYSRYAIDGDRICMRFDSDVQTANPTKLYFGLKEMALKADRQDDLLIREFSQLKVEDRRYMIPVPEREKDIKYLFLKKSIADTVAMVDSLDQNQMAAGAATLLTALAYRIDFLVSPEGALLTELESIISDMVSSPERPSPERNQKTKNRFLQINEKSKEDIFNSLYRTRCTFSVMPPPHEKAVAENIYSAIQNMFWYRDNQYPEIARQMLELGFTSCAYNFNLPAPMKEFLTLFMQVNYTDYFEALGLGEGLYDEKNNRFRKNDLEDDIVEIIERWKDRYPKISFNRSGLRYDNILAFNQTFLTEIQFMNFDTTQ